MQKVGSREFLKNLQQTSVPQPWVTSNYLTENIESAQ